MNVGMPQYGMPFGASSGAPYFNGWSPYGGFGQPQQGYGMSSPFGGFGGGYGMLSPFGGFGGGYGMPFQQMPMGGGKGAYSSPFGQFQTPNFAAKGGTTQPQSPTSNMPSTGQQLTNMNQLPPGSSLPSGYIAPGVESGTYFGPSIPLPSNPGTANLPGSLPPQTTVPPSNQNPMMPPMPHDPMPTSPRNPILGQGGVPTGLIAGQSGVPMSPPSQPAPIPQAVPPQMMNPVSGPVQMLPQQMFNQNRLPGANPISPTRNMLIGGYR